MRTRYGGSGSPTMVVVYAASAALALALAGCDDGPADAPLDGGGVDVAVDAAPVVPDGAVDAALDLGVDAAPDAALMPDAASPDASPPDSGPPACDPALAIEPVEVFSSAFDLTVFTATGGTGAYHFDFAQNDSDAIVNDLSGAYLAGGVEGTVDRVVVTDDGCAGEAVATVYVADPLIIRPGVVEVAAGQTLRFAAEGGAGDYEYSLVIEQSGGFVSVDGLYTAGQALGRDVVRVRDPRTGLEDEAVVHIVDDPLLTVDRPRLYLPVGAQMPLGFTGGSGYLSAEIDGDAARFDAESGVVTGVQPGASRVVLTDDFTGQQVTVDVEVAAALDAPLELAGGGLFATVIRGPGDLDGDGYPDVVVGDPDHSADALRDGAVLVYRGGPDGPEPAPAQVIIGTGSSARLGQALVLADLDRDGELDLIAGAPEDDSEGGDVGIVQIHRGVAGGFFEPEPSLVLRGVRGGDRYGNALAACDYDGDGWVDLAVGAYLFEDRDLDPVNNSQGAIFIHLGGPDGLDPGRARFVTGQHLEDGAWVQSTNLQMPSELAAGDVDGDGRCDLVASATRLDSDAGVIYVYRGRPVGDDGAGGVGPLPARAYLAGEAGSRLGRRLAVADLDGDGRADIVAGQHGFEGDGARDRGAVRVFAGGVLGAAAVSTTSDEAAAWVAYGDNGTDNRGVSVAVGDADGDGLVDLLAGAWHDEADVPGSTSDLGSVAVYRGQPGAWPASAPDVVHYGEAATALFGEAVAVLGDVDDDGYVDLLSTTGRDDTEGVDLTRAYFVPGAAPPPAPVEPGDAGPPDMGADAGPPVEPRPRIGLERAAVPSGAQLGIDAATTGDIDGDGIGDLLVAAPETPLAPNQLRAGEAYLYRGTADGYRAEPSVVFEGHRGHGGTDRFGYGVASGDFDGDGLTDAMIGALAEEWSGTFPQDTYVVDGECPEGRDQGAVHIYRGGPTLDGARPDFIYYGPTANAQAWRVQSADVNGDGLDDLLVGAPNQNVDGVGNAAGGFEIVFGRPPAADGRITVLCRPDFSYRGTVAAGGVGRMVERLGDLDGDGCDDIAVGGDNEDVDLTPDVEGDEVDRGGALRVLWGWGGAGCRANPRMTTFVGTGNQARVGWSAAVGDLFGGPEPELAIGAVLQQVGGNTRFGAVYVIDGAALVALPTHGPAAVNPPREVLAPDGPHAMLSGEVANEQFGRRVQIHDRRLYITRILGAIGGATRLGGGEVYAFDDPQSPRRVASIAGETWRYESRIGDTLRIDPARGLLVVGGYLGSGLYPEAGAVYVFPLPVTE